MTIYNPPRPTRTIEIKRKAAEEFVAQHRSCLPSDIDDEDLIDHLIKHAHAHENGYEIAKTLDNWERWDIEAETVSALDSFDYYVTRQLRTVEAEWIAENNIQPPFPVGTEVEYLYGTWKQGEITGICTHTPGCYLIKEAGQNDEECNRMRAVVKWENVREIKNEQI